MNSDSRLARAISRRVRVKQTGPSSEDALRNARSPGAKLRERILSEVQLLPRNRNNVAAMNEQSVARWFAILEVRMRR
jgi:hypothetical protein